MPAFAFWGSVWKRPALAPRANPLYCVETILNRTGTLVALAPKAWQTNR